MVSRTRLAVYTGIAVFLAYLRLTGHTSEFYQAFAHGFTGGFIGVAIMGACHNVGGWRYYAGLAGALALVEIAAFIYTRVI